LKTKKPGQLRYIGFWPRALAQLIDNLIVTLAMVPVILLFGWSYFDPHRVKSFGEVMYGTVLPLTVLWLLWRYFQSSPGKYLVGAKIVDAETLGQPSGWQLLVRMAGYLPSLLAFGLGFFWVLSDPRRQGWHDKLARTLVVNYDLPPPDPGFKLKTPQPAPKPDGD
jgi:uncharacterized RDD family membrane protein YckC